MAESREALETVELLYRAALEPALWPQALQAIAHAVGGMGTAMIPITPGNTAGLIVSPELTEPNIEYEREWWQRDSRVRRIHARGLSGGVCSEAELFSDDEIKRDPLRQEFLRSYGIGAFAAHLVAPLPDLVVAFSVQRSLKRGQFDKRELATLDLLGRHAARAFVISMRLSAERQVEQTLDATLGQLDCAALVLDRDGKVVLQNEMAGRLMGDGLRISRGRLVAASRDHQQILAQLLRAVLRGQPHHDAGEPIALPRPSGRQSLLVQAVPVLATPEPWTSAGSPAALVIVVDPERNGDRSPLRELRLLGLAPWEARIAALIGSGCSRAEAAAALGISASTAQDGIKQVYAKLKISRQSELVRLVHRLGALKARPRRDD